MKPFFCYLTLLLSSVSLNTGTDLEDFAGRLTKASEIRRIRGGQEGERAVDIAILDSYHRQHEG
jgi:hypothetical protein